MISELNDDEILNFLMTSDLEDDYSPSELKYLIFKWRYFYRVLHSKIDRNSEKYEDLIKNLEDKVKQLQIEKSNALVEKAQKEDIINNMKNRNLTWKERWSGKIILNKDEN